MPSLERKTKIIKVATRITTNIPISSIDKVTNLAQPIDNP